MRMNPYTPRHTQRSICFRYSVVVRQHCEPPLSTEESHFPTIFVDHHHPSTHQWSETDGSGSSFGSSHPDPLTADDVTLQWSTAQVGSLVQRKEQLVDTAMVLGTYGSGRRYVSAGEQRNGGCKSRSHTLLFICFLSRVPHCVFTHLFSCILEKKTEVLRRPTSLKPGRFTFHKKKILTSVRSWSARES